MNEQECSIDDSCEWVENIEIANCYNLSWNEEECISDATEAVLNLKLENSRKKQKANGDAAEHPPAND